MRLRSPEYRGCHERAAVAANMVRAVVVLSIVGLGGGVSQSAAQEAAVAYVKAVNGRVIALARGTPVLLGALDSVADRTRLDLQANSELYLCHHSSGRLHTLRGPLRVAVTAAGVTAENGKTIDRPAGSCAAPAVSKFQGGLLSRGLESDASAAPRIRRGLERGQR